MSRPLKSGDLLLFDGDGMISQMIKFFTGSKEGYVELSHAGIVFECPVTRQFYVWECGNQPRKAGPTVTRENSPHNAAHLSCLSTRLDGYSGIVYRRSLNGNIDNDRFARWISLNLGKPYSFDFIPGWNRRGGYSIISLPFLDDDNEELNDGGWMCSQLVAETYEHIGVFALDRPSRTIMPIDFWDSVPVRDGYTFERPELLYARSNFV